MKQVKLLDCTLRDGGYVNDWEFGHDNIVTIFERLISAGVDILALQETKVQVSWMTAAPSTATARSCRQPSVPIRFSASWTREIQ